MASLQNILDYFGVRRTNDIKSVRNWAKIMKMAKKNTIGKYLGYKLGGNGNNKTLEVLGTKGWIGIDINDFTPKVVQMGVLHENKNLDMKITRSRLKELVRETINRRYRIQNFFQKGIRKTGKSIPSMSDEEKKAFFNKVDAAWKGKGEKKEVNEAFGNDAQMAKLHSVLAHKKFMAQAIEDEFLSKVNGMTNGYFKSGMRNTMLKKVYKDYVKNPKGFKYDDSKYRLEESKK